MDNKNSYIWLISFGDLLTLVLCFFVLLISLKSAENRKMSQEVIVKADTYPELANNSQENASKQKSGIGLALIDQENQSKSSDFLKQHSLRLDFYEDDFDKSHEQLSVSALKRLKDAVFRAGYKDSIARVEFCKKTELAEQEISKRQTGKMLVGMRRQLVDTLENLKSERISLGIIGTQCDAPEVIARIEFEV